ncbi:MAG TPA: universal stress protein [Candidatus Eremiobacteraceae bacterium]
MLIVICLDLEDGIDPIKGLAGSFPLDGADVTLLHVVDTAERAKLEDAVRPGIVRPPLTRVEDDLDADEQRMLRETYDEASSILRGCHAGEITLNVGSGRPERVIVSYLAEMKAGLCVMARRPDWKQNRDSGPHSVGHVARFVVDHAPCPVLLLR